MLSELEVLNGLLVDEAKVFCKGKTITLKEPQAKDSMVSISNIPDDAVFIKCDKFEAPKRVFTTPENFLKRSSAKRVALGELL